MLLMQMLIARSHLLKKLGCIKTAHMSDLLTGRIGVPVFAVKSLGMNEVE